jgi:hypothetical protein
MYATPHPPKEGKPATDPLSPTLLGFVIGMKRGFLSLQKKKEKLERELRME